MRQVRQVLHIESGNRTEVGDRTAQGIAGRSSRASRWRDPAHMSQPVQRRAADDGARQEADN